MKAIELMIGDWMFNKPTCKPFKVYPSFFSQLTNFGEKMDAKCENFGAYPIELTDEILEDNGFAVHCQFATFTEYWLDIPQKWVRVAPNSYIEIYNGENRNVHIDGKVYVHELQHALRLCGLYAIADNLRIE